MLGQRPQREVPRIEAALQAEGSKARQQAQQCRQRLVAATWAWQGGGGWEDSRQDVAQWRFTAACPGCSVGPLHCPTIT